MNNYDLTNIEIIIKRNTSKNNINTYNINNEIRDYLFNRNLNNNPVINLKFDSNIFNKNNIKDILNNIRNNFNIINYNCINDHKFMLIFSDFISLLNFSFYIKDVNSEHNNDNNLFHISFIKLKQIKNINNNLINNLYEEDNSIKYSTKYIFNPRICQSYPLSKKVIGIKGVNMKRILEKYSTSGNLKLRLRGKGSGFYEGLEKKESNESLHLCLTANNQQIFQKACKDIETLLHKINNEYSKLYNTQEIIYTKHNQNQSNLS